MTDRVEKFTQEFESAIDTHRRFASDRSTIAAAKREAGQLASTLDRLALAHGAATTLSPSDLRTLHDELEAMGPPPLDQLLANARALLQVVDDGIIDGDATLLRALLAEAEAISPVRQRDRSSGQTHLDTPAKAICLECDDLLVGRRQPALNWNAITKVIRDHSRDCHGGHTDEIRDQMSQALRDLRTGKEVVTAGRYRIGQL